MTSKWPRGRKEGRNKKREMKKQCFIEFTSSSFLSSMSFFSFGHKFRTFWKGAILTLRQNWQRIPSISSSYWRERFRDMEGEDSKCYFFLRREGDRIHFPFLRLLFSDYFFPFSHPSFFCWKKQMPRKCMDEKEMEEGNEHSKDTHIYYKLSFSIRSLIEERIFSREWAKVLEEKGREES